MKRLLPLVLLAAMGLAPGCSTMAQAIMTVEGPAAMGGVRYGASILGGDHWTGAEKLHVLLDFPLSFGADFLILPYSLVNEVTVGGMDVRAPTDSKPISARKKKPVVEERPTEGEAKAKGT